MWAILRDGAVIWNVDLTGSFRFETRSAKNAPGIVVLHGLSANGVPVTVDDISLIDPMAAESDGTIEADEDVTG